jgi:putative membrane protein
MSELILEKRDKVYIPVIAGLSLAVALAVAILFYLPYKGSLDVGFLPTLNAILNSGTALALVLGFTMVKKKNIKGHRVAMFTAFLLSSVFLVSYVLYHANSEHTTFPTDNPYKYLYYFILLTHILLSAIIVPLVLTSIYFAVSQQIDRHKKIVKFTFPIWLYVSITGVIVFLMISPYYK